MRYSELPEAAKAKARRDYQLGWLETHEDVFSEAELDSLCQDLESEIDYDEKGNVV